MIRPQQNTEALMQQYQFAWLELQKRTWYFVTDVRADAKRSPRQWEDKDKALSELTEEGWTVRGPYPILESLGKDNKRAVGLGLMRSLQ